MYLPSSLILRYARAEMNMHAFMNELDQKDLLISKKNQKNLKSMYKVNGELSSCDITYSRGRHTQICIITSLKWIMEICSNFYCCVCKITFYSPNPHYCLRKLPL